MSRMIVPHQLNFYKFWLLLGIFLLIAIVYLSLTSRPMQMVSFVMSDKLAHLFAYFSLMVWFGQIYTGTHVQIILAVGFCVMGVILELLQYIGGHRMLEYRDMMANTAGVGLGWLTTRYLISGLLVKIDRNLEKVFKL